MKPPSEIRLWAKLAGMLLVVGGTVTLAAWNVRAESGADVTNTDKVVAKVDGKPIYETQLKSELEQRLRRFRKYGMHKDDAALVKRLRHRILDRVIGEQLIYRESQKLTIKNIDQRVEQKLKALQVKYGTGERFKRYLKSKKLSMEDLKETLRARVYVTEYLKKQGILEPEIPEENIKKAYEQHPENYAQKETVKVSHILIAVTGHPDAEKTKQARQEAERIRQELLHGADFAELAREHSTCNSAANGGSLGYIKRGYMPPEFDQVAFTLKKGAISDVVKTKFGFHIIKVLDKKPAGVVPYEKVRTFIKKYLQQEEAKKKLAAHIAQLKKKAKIEILLND